jgi:hypothetical protein
LKYALIVTCNGVGRSRSLDYEDNYKTFHCRFDSTVGSLLATVQTVSTGKTTWRALVSHARRVR